MLGKEELRVTESESCKGYSLDFLEAFASIPTYLFPEIQRSARQWLYLDF